MQKSEGSTVFIHIDSVDFYKACFFYFPGSFLVFFGGGDGGGDAGVGVGLSSHTKVALQRCCCYLC